MDRNVKKRTKRGTNFIADGGLICVHHSSAQKGNDRLKKPGGRNDLDREGTNGG